MPILGYRLYVDSGLNDNFKMIYDGLNMPEVFSYIYISSSLNNKLNYRFYVTAINFNGEGLASPIAAFKPCTAPSDFEKPSIVEVTEVSIIVEWIKP